MNTEKIKYVLFGVLGAIIMMILLSVNSTEKTENGRYQIAATGPGSIYAVDTQTGIVKRVNGSGSEQLGKSFEEMSTK